MAVDATQLLVAGVRVLLRRVSDIKLPDADIRQALIEVLSGYAQDLKLTAHRDRATRIAEVEFDEGDTLGEYEVTLPDVGDVEVMRLELSAVDNENAGWAEVGVVPVQAFSGSAGAREIMVAFYENSTKALVNLAPEAAAQFIWRMTYRPSILAILQAGAKTPLPDEFLPMAMKAAAVKCMPLVDDDGQAWVAWSSRTKVDYRADLLEWDDRNPRTPGRWQEYLFTSNEPQVRSIRPFNAFRGGRGRRGPRGFVPRQ